MHGNGGSNACVRNGHEYSGIASWLFVAFSLLVVLLSAAAHAATERYDYDALGRLIRWVDGAGQATEYVYDAAGNLKEVIAAGTATVPPVASVTPDALRRGEVRDVMVIGSGLTGTRLSMPDAGLTISGFAATATQASFRLSAGATAVLGSQAFALTNAAGTAAFSLRIDPVLPTMLVSPTPLAVPPDGVARAFTIRLSNTDHYDHTITLSTADASIASVTPASVTIPAGQTEVRANITGLKAGTTSIRLSSATLGTTSVPVFITGDFIGLNTSHASLLGVVKETTAPPPATRSIDTLASPLLGLARGPVIQAITPGALGQGSGPTELIISGRELQGVTGVQIQPADGLILGALTVNPDGTRVTVPVTVAVNAPTTWRQVKLSGAGAPYLPASPQADRLLITLPQPEILSIDPLFARPGDTLTLTVRGRNLQGASAVSVMPADLVTVGASPSVNAEGTLLTVGVSVSILAQPGQRVVTVTTPAGDTPGQATSANTFSIVNEIQGAITPVASALLGVLKESEPTPTQTPVAVQSSQLGVTTGPVVTGITPTVGSVGETVTLTISGNELSGVTHVEFAPTEGLQIGAPSVAPDGRSLTVSVVIDTAAARTPRKIAVKAGTMALPFATSDAAVFRVVAPQPQIQSVSPLHIVAGAAPVTLTVRGRNLQGADLVGILPADHMTVSVPPTVNGDGTELTVNVDAAANAALGNRVVTVRTPAGETEALAVPSNTIAVVTNAGSTYTPVAAPNLGVVKETAPPPPATQDVPVQSALLGVVLETVAPPASQSLDQRSPLLGVVVGPVALGMQAPYLTPGTAGELVMTGSGLDSVASAAVEGAAGITLGAPATDPAGTELRLAISVEATAAAGSRRVKLLNASALAVPFADPRSAQFTVAAGAPRMDSIDPILADQGDTLTLLVRGANLQGGRVVVEPADGIQIGAGASANANGTELTVGLAISGDAAIGARVIRIETAGGITPADASPFNTFTIYPKP